MPIIISPKTSSYYTFKIQRKWEMHYIKMLNIKTMMHWKKKNKALPNRMTLHPMSFARNSYRAAKLEKKKKKQASFDSFHTFQQNSAEM